MRVHLLGTVAVSNGDSSIRGRELGGRHARLLLAVLALADGPVPAARLATYVWGDQLPATWPVGLRGVVRSLRRACTPIGGGGQQLIFTSSSGYGLSSGVDTDIEVSGIQTRKAADLLGRGHHREAAETAGPSARLHGDQVLPGEDLPWLEPHRRAVDARSLHAAQIVVEATGMLGDHPGALAIARHSVTLHPLDESTHRVLIAALDRAGDRAGAVRAYEDCRNLLGEQLGVDPSPETVQVYLHALREQTRSDTARIPVPQTSFIGREIELEKLAEALGRPGLVALTGRGGVGKSRLAIRAANRRATFPGGRLWLSLAAVADDELVSSGVALLLGAPAGSDDPAEAVADQLAPLGRALLILDGCEGVIDGVATMVATLLARAPMLTVLVTSRRPLSVEGERVIAVEPLPAPELGPGQLRNGQLRLLLDRVAEVGGELVLDEVTTPHVLALCEHCGGLPLALELVASQLAAMSAGDLLDHLRDQPPQQNNLRAIAYSSYVLLGEDEATVFRAMGVLDGQVALSLVRQVVSHSAVPPVRVVRILRELTARGLLAVDRSGAHWRFEQDDDLHRFAQQLLIEHGEEWATYDRLAAAIRLRLPDDARAAPVPFRAEITELIGSVRSLFAAAIGGRTDLAGAQELAFRLHRYFAATNVAEGRFWLSRLLAAGADGPAAPYATYALGYLSYWAGHTEDAMRHLTAAATLLEAAPDPYRARTLIFLAGLLDDLDRGQEALHYVGLSIDAAAPFDVDLQCSAAMGMGSILGERVDPAAAGYARDAIALCRTGGSQEELAIALPTAAMICWQVGDLATARDFVAEALPLNTGTVRIARVVLLSAAAGMALADGDAAGAIEVGSQALAESTELGVEREVPLIAAVLSRAYLTQHDLIAAGHHAAGALEAALAMSNDFPMALALETAALVLGARGLTQGPLLSRFLTVADDLRRTGDRPAPATLAPAVRDLRLALAAHPDLTFPNDRFEPPGDARAAARLAQELLGQCKPPSTTLAIATSWE